MDGKGYTPTVSSYFLDVLMSISAIILIVSVLLSLAALFLCLRNWYYGMRLRFWVLAGAKRTFPGSSSDLLSLFR